MKLSPPMVERRPDDLAGNYAAWIAEWRRVHPALRWMIGYWWFVGVFGGVGIGFVLGMLVGS